jgi:hypothetical protein
MGWNVDQIAETNAYRNFEKKLLEYFTCNLRSARMTLKMDVTETG